MNRRILFILTLLGSLMLHGQEKPVIGLVLSGGGAKSLTQIGVLKVLERAGVRPDYIAGTSMGAVVGALYAQGYSATEVEAILRNVNWEELISNQLTRDKLTFIDKRADEKYLISFPFLGTKPQLPDALNYGQSIQKNLSFLTLRAQGIEDFSQFPIPFVCVATELETGTLHSFESGDLGDALRASSAFPTLFSPYEIDGCLYTDGGIINNFPVSILREKGVDLIIGVDVQDEPYSQEQINSIAKVLEQTSTYQNRANTAAGRADADYLLIPSLPGLGLTTFELFDEAVAAGEAEAMKYWQEWVALGNADSALKPGPVVNLYFDTISFSSDRYSSQKTLTRWMGFDSARVYTAQELQRGIDRIYASQLYKGVDFRVDSSQGKRTLAVRLTERKTLSQVRLGLNYNDDFRAAILTNFTIRNALFKNDRFLVDVAIGEWPRVFADYSIDKGIIPTIGLSFDYNRIPTGSYQDGRQLNRYAFSNVAGNLYVRSILLNTYAIGGGLRLETMELNGVITETAPQNYLGSFLHYYAFLDFDSYNRSFYPTEGFKFLADFRGIQKHSDLQSFESPISFLHGRLEGSVPLFEKAGLIPVLQTGLTFGPTPDLPYFNYLGGQGERYPHFIAPFLGYNFMEIQTRNYLLGRLDFFYEPWKNHFFTAKYNMALIDFDPTAPNNNSNLRDGLGLSYGYLSPFGPLELIVSANTARRGALAYIRLGFWF